MAEFVSWSTELLKARNAIANREWDAYFLSSVQNSREMQTTYTKLGNVTAFIDWLEQKATQEVSSFSDGEIPMSVGGF